MQEIFAKAMENGLLVNNPAENLSRPKAVEGTHRALTAPERNAFLKVCETNLYGLWGLVMYYCGLRPGETGRIQGRHIDLKKRILHVDGTKTAAAKRDVPIPEKLAQRLAERQVGAFNYLFINRFNSPINKTNRRRMWESIIKDMHIMMGGKTDYGDLRRVLMPTPVSPDLVPYCLRHDYCTRLQAAGVPINVAREFMGHSSIEMTSRIYTHSSKESFESALDKIDSFDSGVPMAVPHDR